MTISATAAEYTCRACGAPATRIELRDGERRSQPFTGDGEPAVLTYCARSCSPTWQPKLDNADRRRVANTPHRKRWREQLGGELACAWCGIRESQTRSQFEIDHIVPHEFGGPDEFWNTLPLCRPHHVAHHSEQCVLAHALGRSARDAPTAAKQTKEETV